MTRKMKRLNKIIKLYKGNLDEYGHVLTGEIHACKKQGETIINSIVQSKNKEIAHSVFTLLSMGDFRDIKGMLGSDFNIEMNKALQKLKIKYQVENMNGVTVFKLV